MDVVVERCAGIDVHKDMVAVCVRVPGPDGERTEVLAEFSTFTEELLVLRDWLVAHGVTRVGMEATGVYWKPVVRHEALFDREGMKGPLLRVVVATR
jgi:transposase